MALTLHLLRHGKSSWKDPGQTDHDRSLNGRGREAADAMGKFLGRTAPVPERVLCSSAVRTQETWKRIRKGLPNDPAILVERELYLAPAAAMLSRVRMHGDDASCLLLIAHNPGTSDLARGLAGSGDRDAWDRMRSKYPTCALATLRFDVAEWADVTTSSGELVRFMVPRDL